ncbi:hypothetical protein [Dactylosporangium sp. NPDC050588]|uniref:hypothetical protein n=1 Tax=Dactylosporangium sp. NPDC050588 TaxID=3157211 RepID=UPI0033F78F8B
MALASGLAEAGQFAQAVTAQREVVDSHRAAEPQNQAMGHLATGDYATATDGLREALALHATTH